MKVLITGSSGLVGSTLVMRAHSLGWRVVGIDNDSRKSYFGEAGSTRKNLERLEKAVPTYRHYDLDVRERDMILHIWKQEMPDAVVHCAAQPSHDKAAQIPFDDFDTNAVGTLNLLEATRRSIPSAPFVYLSTNKVYGSKPNEKPLVELPTRWEFQDKADYHGIDERCSIDDSMHSLFGASKLAGDILVQEYGRYFGMPTISLRPGCITGPHHSGVQLHGFLNYLVRCCIDGRPYTIIGHKGKQVRDQIHVDDLASAILMSIESPLIGRAFNIGGGRGNSASVLESIALAEEIADKRLSTSYTDQARLGDHICYISDVRRFQSVYVGWRCRYSLRDIVSEMVDVMTSDS